MIYLDLGYNKFLVKQTPDTPEIADSDFEQLVDTINAGKINQGTSQSKTMKINYDAGTIERKEGAVTRLSLGKFNDGKYGLRVFSAGGILTIDQSA